MGTVIPRLRFAGADSALQMNRIFAENVRDLRDKVDPGGDPRYGAGFLHTSTLPHEGTCYYDSMWSRDGGRGLVELARLGFADEAEKVARFLLDHVNYGDHWGRMVDKGTGKEEMALGCMACETDGNALSLLGIHAAWKANGMSVPMAREFLQGVWPIVGWVEREMDASPYGDLLPAISELSGNTNTDYRVYAIYPNYAMRVALAGLLRMARRAGMAKEAEVLGFLHARLSRSLLDRLVSGRDAFRPEMGGLTVFEDFSPVPEGCWINGIDGRSGKEYRYSDWGGLSFPIHHWTRQVPFVLDSDLGSLRLAADSFLPVQTASYGYLHGEMCGNRHFRKNGFVSNTAWTGMGGRHDDTMCGYGQGLFTQAALAMDDVNTYSRLVEGLARLAYDGDVVQPKSFEMNPWVFHECFDHDAYEDGRDHTFGALSEGRYGVMDNPGDEGNLVQEAEALKCIALMAGVDDGTPGLLRLLPRIPWNWDVLQVRDMPFVRDDGDVGRLDYTLEHERWLRRTTLRVRSSIPVANMEARLGPFPAHTDFAGGPGLGLERSPGATWILATGLSGTEMEVTVSLDG